MDAGSKPGLVAAAFRDLPATITVGALVVRFDQVLAGDRAVVVTGSVSRDGQPVYVDWPVVVVNPPLRAVSVGGAPIDDPAFALAQVIAQVAGG